jgi:PAS domain S-box-containing protein
MKVKEQPIEEIKRLRQEVAKLRQEKTERKKAEAALRKGRERYNQLVNSITDVFFAFDKDLKYTHWNAASEKLTKISAEDAIGKSLYDLFPNTPQTRVAEKKYREVLRTGQPQIFVNEYKIGGKDYYFEISVYPLKDGISVFTKDITERKQVEAARREGDARYHALFDRTLYCVYVHDFEGRFLDANDAALKLLGYTREEVLSLNISSLLGEDQLPTAFKTTQEIKQTGRHKGITEYKLRTKDGDYVWVETEASLIYREGVPYAIQGIARDITERKQAEEKLRQSEKKYRTILENITDGYYELDLAGNLTFFNDSLCQTLGYTRDELMGMNNRQYMDKENAAKVYQIFNEVYRTGKPCTRVDWDVIRKDGTKLSISSSASLIRDSQGKPTGFRGLSRNITEQKRAEEKLRQSEEKYRSILENTVEGYYETDLAGNCTFANNSICVDMGYSRDKLIGMNNRQYMDKENARKIYQAFTEVYTTGQPARGLEFEAIRKDGRKLCASCSVSLIRDSKGEPIGFQGVVRDVTEHKQAEEALEESEEKYRTQFEQAMDAIVLADAETGIVIDCNRAACKLVGRKKSELVGQHQRILHPPQEMEGELTTTFKQHLGEKEGKTVETQVITKNGEIKEVAIKANIIEFRGKKLLQGIFRDITERKQAEKTLQEAKTRFENLFETANELIITTDAEGWVLHVNKEIEKLSGYSKKELIGKSILEIAYPEDKDKYVQFWQDILNGLSPHYELRTISKTGVVSNLLASGNAIRKDGNIVEIQYNAKDITEEKQAEEELRRSEGKYRSILENITDGYYELDLAGNLTFFNASLCQTLGYARDEMMGMNNRQYMDEENAAKVYQIFNEVYRTGKPYTRADWAIIRKDGTKLSISSSVSLIRDSQGKPIGFRGLSRDITQQKRAEEELRRSEEKYRTVLESVVEGYYEVDLAGNFTFVNDSICHNIGYSRDELLSMNNRDYMDEQTAKKVLERYAEVYTTGQPARGFDFEITRKDGTKLFISVSISLIRDSKGEPTGFRGVVRDITEQKQAEEKLQAGEERYRNLFENATDGIFTLDLKTRFTSGNKKAQEMCGYNKEELIGQYATVILPEEEIPRMADILKMVLNGEINTYETKIITKNGDLIPVEVTSSPIEVDGKIVGAMGMARDITERKRWEEMLRQSEKKYRTILENITDGYYEVDLAGNFTFFNDSMCKMLGYSKNEIIGMNDRQYTDKENARKVYQAFNKVYNTGKSAVGFDWELTRKDGTKIIVEASITLIRNPEGEPIGFRGVVRDITERKQAEKALQEAKTHFEDLFETANELIITTDAEGWVLRLNKEVEKLSGYSKKELIGKSILEIAYPEDTPKYIQFWKDILSGLDPHYELRAVSAKKHGDIRYLLASGSAIRKDGNVVEIQYNAKDITEERQADEKLRQSEEKYRSILENITDGYYELDLAGNFIFFNDSTCKMLGYPRNELLGMNNREYEDKENARKVYQAFTEVYTTGKPIKELEFEAIRKDGTKVFIVTSASLIRDARDEPIGFRGVSRDITARKQSEAERAELEKKAQLATRLGVIGEMASGIVHEINNPLTSVIGFAEMLAQKELPEDAKEYVRIINSEGKRVAGIASRLLNFSRHQNPGTVYTDINELIEATIELQQYEMTSGNIKITTKLDPHLPRTMADPGQMQQVFLNIMLNARTAMRLAHGGGKLLIKTKAMDNTIQISFKDDGPGIAKKNLQRIFEPFFTTRKPGEGTGLGLSICQNIIATHDGTIYARSKLGKGATFIIKLPVVARQRKTDRNGGANHINGNPWR